MNLKASGRGKRKYNRIDIIIIREVEHTVECVMIEYVQGASPDRWHWCKNCSLYPLKVYKKRSRKPTYDLCDECKLKESKKDCIT